MNELISPKYQMNLVKSVYKTVKKEYKTLNEIRLYVEKWHKVEHDWNNHWENFVIAQNDSFEIDLFQTLHNLSGIDLLKIAIDLGLETPDFIPSIPTFKNELKSDYKTAYGTFTKAYNQIETDPSLAIGLANSALESIIKEILKDSRINLKITGNETLYKLTSLILKEFNISNGDNPMEIKIIGSSFLAINQAIEKLRSEKTDFHGKTEEDFIIKDTIYAYFVINSVATIGLFLNSYYRSIFPKPVVQDDNLPF